MTSGCFERMAAAGQSKSEKPMGRGQGGSHGEEPELGKARRGGGQRGELKGVS